jgi:hypothetical protein
VPDLDQRPGREADLVDARAVDPRAVAAPEIADHVAVAAGLDLGVAARHPAIRQLQLAAVRGRRSGDGGAAQR